MRILLCYSVISIVKDKSSSPSIAYVQFFVYMNSTEKLINPFAIGYMVNHALHDNKVFRKNV